MDETTPGSAVLPAHMADFDVNAYMALLDNAGVRPSQPVKISFRGRQGYSKDVGFYLKPDNGKRTYRRWWLGHDQSRALWLATLITTYFEQFVKTSGGLWTPHHLRALNLVIEAHDHLTQSHAVRARRALQNLAARPPLTEMLEMPATSSSARRRPEGIEKPQAVQNSATLYGAISAYLEAMARKRISPSHAWRATQILDRDLKEIRSDLPLAKIDYLWLDQLADHFKSRPKSKRDGKPIKPQTVVTTLRYLRAFFVWLDDSGFGGWHGPAKLTRPFRVTPRDLMTPSELRTATAIQQFDTATLVKLYAAANPLQRALMLTALFTGGTQQELAVLEKSEFDFEEAVLVHHRNKTLVEGRFWLPPELVELLGSEFRRDKRNRLAFRTPDGNPLVVFKNGRQTSDFVRQSWDDLRHKAGLPNALSFKFLRKFVADWMTRHGGESIGQIALSHARQTVLAKHYTTTRDFESLRSFQQQMYEEFRAAGMFACE